VIAAEDFGASPSSSQQVCLAGVHEADAVVLRAGERTGVHGPCGGAAAAALHVHGGSPLLHVTVAGAPAQQVMRPSDLGDPVLQAAVEQEALFGKRPVFDRREGVQASVSGTTLVIRQPNAEITVDERGSIRMSRPSS
jgi:hypothetical protein